MASKNPIPAEKNGLLSLLSDEIPVRSGGFPRSVIVTCSLSVVVAFSILLSAVPRGFVNGDAPVYAERIAKLLFGDGSVHIGYYAVGFVFTRLLPLDPPLALNVMSALFGALCIGLVSTIAYTLSGRVSASIAGAAALLSLPVFFENAAFAEIYMVQLFFFLLCVQFTLWDRPIVAGLAFACALLVTPSTILAAPFLILLRPRPRFLAVAALSCALLAGLVVAPHYRDYLWGGIGVLHLQAPDVNVATAVPKEIREAGGLSAVLLGVLAGAGMATLIASPKRRRLALAIAILWLIPFVVGERYSDVPVQLPLYGILAVTAGIGAARLIRQWPRKHLMASVAVIAIVLSVALPGAATYPSIRQRSLTADSFQRDIRSMAAQMKRGDVVVAKWPTDRIARYYLDDRPNLTWLDYEALVSPTDSQAREAAWSRLASALTARQRLWLIDTPQSTQYLESQGYTVTSFKQFIFVATPGAR